MRRATFLTVATLFACHSGDAPAPSPSPSESAAGTKIVVASPPTTSPAQRCRVRIAGDAFAHAREGLGARAVAAVHVDGDYTRALAKVAVEPVVTGPVDAGQPVGSWSGSFNGPRDAFLEMLQRHVCTDDAKIHVLLPRGAKDPSKGEVVLDVFALTADEHRDVDNLCHAYERAPKPATASKDAADAAAMQWVEEVLTSERWDDWRRGFGRERSDLVARKADATALFHARGSELASAAGPEKLPCPTAQEWARR